MEDDPVADRAAARHRLLDGLLRDMARQQIESVWLRAKEEGIRDPVVIVLAEESDAGRGEDGLMFNFTFTAGDRAGVARNIGTTDLPLSRDVARRPPPETPLTVLAIVGDRAKVGSRPVMNKGKPPGD